MKCCSLHDNKKWDKDYCSDERCCKKCPYLQSDFPTAWNVIKKTKPEDHHERCSFRYSEGGMLCDCAAITVFIETIKLQQKKVAQQLGKLGGQKTASLYGKKHFSEAGKKGMAKRWSKKDV